MTIQKRLRLGERAIAKDLNTKGGVLQTSQIPTSQPASPPIQVSRWARNGKHPNALLESMKADALNSAAMFLGKEAYSSPGYLGLISNNNAVQPRWRCAFHTGPFTQFIDVTMYLASDFGFGTASSFGQFDLTSAAGTTTETFPIGASVISATTQSWTEIYRPITRRMQVTPNTNYTGLFTDNGTTSTFGHIVELASMTALNGGYLSQNISATGPIVSAYRQNAAEVLRALWQQGGWQLGSWSLEDGTQIPACNTTTWTNVMDTVCVASVTTLGSQTVTPNTPGWIIDTTGRGRRSQASTGIPVVLAIYGNGFTPGDASFRIVDPTGTAMFTGTIGSVAGWYYITGTLPVNKNQKYDLQFTSASSFAVSFYAASLYELG